MSLERRYRRLLRAYPAAYRAERGEEIIGTYLALARPGRRWPSPADAADVLAGGFREQLRAHRAEGLLAGLGLAATLALGLSGAVAAWLLLHSAPDPAVVTDRPHAVWSLATLDVLPDIAWVLAALAAGLRTSRVSKILLGAGLVLALALVPAAGLISSGGATMLYFLIPQCVLAVLGFAAPHRPPGLARLAPPLAVAVVAGQALLTAHSVRLPWDPSALPWIVQPWAELLLAGTLLGGLAWAAWRDSRGLWAALVLSPALALVWVLPREYLAAGHQPAAVLLDSAVVLVSGLALVLAAVRINGLAARLRAARPGGISRAPRPRPGA